MRHQLAGIRGELLEKPIFRWGQPHFLAFHGDEAAPKVDANAPIFEDRRRRQRLPSAAQEGTNASQKLISAKWLGEVIVSAQIERADLVLIGLSATEDQNGNRRLLPNLLTDGEPVQATHDQVQNDQIRGPVLEDVECLLAASSAARIARLAQQTTDQGDEVGVIVYYEHPSFVHFTSLFVIACATVRLLRSGRPGRRAQWSSTLLQVSSLVRSSQVDFHDRSGAISCAPAPRRAASFLKAVSSMVESEFTGVALTRQPALIIVLVSGQTRNPCCAEFERI
jgi:hypothetical protein